MRTMLGRVTQESFPVIYKGKKYKCIVSFKRVKYIYFRLSKDGSSLYVSSPKHIKLDYIKDRVKIALPKLVSKKESKSNYESPVGKDSMYLFGEKRYIPGLFDYTNKQIELFMKNQLMEYLKVRCPEIEKEMKPRHKYQIKIRSMSSRYGVNNINNLTITLSTYLVHYSKEIIDSVIYHEFTHDWIRDHSKRFYDRLYKYCPNYDILRKKLIKHVYA